MTTERPPRSILAVDFGAALSHGALLEPVEGVYRLVAHAETPTARTPEVDLLESLRGCAARLRELVGRPLLGPDGAPHMPAEGPMGVDALIVTASAAPPLDCALIGLTEELSLQSGLMACRASHAHVGSRIALAGDPENRRRALAGLREQPPEVIVLVGGVDGGPVRLLVQAAEALAALFGPEAPASRPAVILAGNPEARRPVAQALGAGWEYAAVDNVQPNLRRTHAQELQRELAQLYVRRKLAQLRGYERLAAWSSAPILASDAGLGIVLQFLSRQAGHRGGVLGLDLGAGQTTAILATDGLTWSRGPAHRLAGEPGALWERYAAAQEALAPVLGDLAAMHAEGHGEDRAVELIAARGGLLASQGAAPWAALALLDAVQPPHATRIVLDWASLWPQLGALAQVAPLAALQVLRRDALLELGTVLRLPGQGRPGQRAGRARLVTGQGRAAECEISWGHLARMPLAEGAEATLEMEPGRRTAVRGGRLGVLLDARGRPLALPQAPEERHRVVEEWVRELGR